MTQQTINLMVSFALVLQMTCFLTAGVLVPGDYIGGDARSEIDEQGQVPGGGGRWPNGFVTNSGDGPSEFGTRSSDRTVNGHLMSTGGPRGTLAAFGDSGWLGAFNNNASNPASQTGDNWLSYAFDDVYALGPIRWWNWNNTADFGPSSYAGGIKTVKIDYANGGIGGPFTTLGTFEIPQQPDPVNVSEGTFVGDFNGVMANAVVVTIVDSWPMTIDGSHTVTHHGLGSIAFDIVSGGELPPERIWNVDSQGDWNNGDNWSPVAAPNANDRSAILGDKITSPRTITTDSAVTVNSITFLNANRYVVAGAGSVNLEGNTTLSTAEINVIVGHHEFQAPVNLKSDTNVTIAGGFALDFNNRLNLNGHTFNKLGDGEVAVNNILSTGGGTVNVQAGTISGNGSIGGDVINGGGVIWPGTTSGVNAALADGAYKAAVPEPSAMVILGLGWVGVYGLVRRHTRWAAWPA